jgi:sensor domain CHASE-containing protein/signal transduction histidine kinase
MTNSKKLLIHWQPIMIAVISFTLLALATLQYSNYKRGQWGKDIRAKVLENLIAKKSNLEKALYSRIYYTRGVAGFVSLKPDISNDEFQQLAAEYIKKDQVISSMSLSRNCILGTIYPIKNHEAAIGLNLLQHPERKEIVEKTIRTRETFVAGPVELVEGGIAFVSYTPIFDKTRNNVFWGVTDIVIYRDKLFEEANIITHENGYDFALRGYNGLGSKGRIFWGDQSVFERNPVKVEVNLPIGSWILATSPANGWAQFTDQDKALTAILLVSSLIISILIWLFTRALMKLKKSERELKAIFESLDTLLIEFSKRGADVKILKINNHLLVKSVNGLPGKSLYDIFEKTGAEKIYQAIDTCLTTGNLVILEYSQYVAEEERWFMARVSKKNSDSVIFNAYDITEKKKDEDNLRKSELQLKEAIALKDQFYSIIAHDLRGPIGGIFSLTEMLNNEFDSWTDEEKKECHALIQKSAKSLFELLENLLQWSGSQNGNIQLKLETKDLKTFCDKVLDIYQLDAQLKNVRILNEIPPRTMGYFDENLSKTILRNLISNAIKFSNENQNIRISVCTDFIENKKYHVISVSDEGIGISDDKISELYAKGSVARAKGSHAGNGNGLGLMLCKDFIEKQGGKIRFKSIPGKGTTVSFNILAGEN